MIFAFAGKNRHFLCTKVGAGFSLAEAVIVLGVVGVVLAAVWATLGPVRESIKRNEAAQQIELVVNNVRALYQGRANISGNFVDLTRRLIQQGAIPQDMIRRTALPASFFADHPWGQSAANGAFLANGGFAVDDNNGDGQSFRVELRGLGLDSCIALAMRFTQQTKPFGLLGITINNQVQTLPVTIAAARTACSLSLGNATIDYIYRLRG